MELNLCLVLIKDNKLLVKDNDVWEKVKDNLKKEFNSEQVYNKKHLKAKIKSYNWQVSTNFHSNKIPKEDSQYICWSVILINSVFRMGKNYYPEVFLQECKYVIKEKMFIVGSD